MSSAGPLTTDFSWDQYSSPLTIDSLPMPQTGKYALEATSALVGTQKREKEFQNCIAALRSYRILPANWDTYGGVAAEDGPIEFAVNLINKAQITPQVSAPLVRPISGGVYLEWRFDDRLLYFEVDEESVLRYSRNAFGEETEEDATFDSAKAYQVVVGFHENAA